MDFEKQIKADRESLIQDIIKTGIDQQCGSSTGGRNAFRCRSCKGSRLFS